MTGSAMCPCASCFNAPPRPSPPPKYTPPTSTTMTATTTASTKQPTVPPKVYKKSSGGGGFLSGRLKRTVSVESASSDLVKLRSAAQPPAYSP